MGQAPSARWQARHSSDCQNGHHRFQPRFRPWTYSLRPLQRYVMILEILLAATTMLRPCCDTGAGLQGTIFLQRHTEAGPLPTASVSRTCLLLPTGEQLCPPVGTITLHSRLQLLPVVVSFSILKNMLYVLLQGGITGVTRCTSQQSASCSAPTEISATARANIVSVAHSRVHSSGDVATVTQLSVTEMHRA